MTCHQWTDAKGIQHIGQRVLIRGDQRHLDKLDDWLSDNDLDLVRHYHSGELELVESSRLRPYPSEPIQEPGK